MSTLVLPLLSRGISGYPGLRLVSLLVLSDLGQDQVHGFAVSIWLSIDAAMMGSILPWRARGTCVRSQVCMSLRSWTAGVCGYAAALSQLICVAAVYVAMVVVSWQFCCERLGTATSDFL